LDPDQHEAEVKIRIEAFPFRTRHVSRDHPGATAIS
jgi:hypothetical protein